MIAVIGAILQIISLKEVLADIVDLSDILLVQLFFQISLDDDLPGIVVAAEMGCKRKK